jgi:hypothetical protein
MENILIGLILGLFLEGKNHETPQNEQRRQPPSVFCNCIPEPQKELRREPDAGWNPAVIHAMPKPDICQ